MRRGFYTLIAAQFLSALADNALLLLVIALLQAKNHEAFWIPVIKLMFTLSYVLAGPWVGAWADNKPKHMVMMQANSIKIIACLLLLCGIDPILAFTLTGMGAAFYAPAKYGLITELVKSEQLVHANAWIEVSVVCAALFGVMLGGVLVASHWIDSSLYQMIGNYLPANQMFNTSIAVLLVIYLFASLVNTQIPDSGRRYAPAVWNLNSVWTSFIHDQKKLWRDPLGSISLSVTSLFWGVGASMQLLVLAWSQTMLDLNLTQAAYLQAATAVGVVMGALLASRLIDMKNAPRVLIAGVLLGMAIPLMTIIHDWRWALVLTLGLGMLGGFFVVPMNAMLQARGVELLSAGRSISVQNTCENTSVLLMLSGYSALVFFHVSVNGLIWALAALIVSGMCLTLWRYQAIRRNTLL